MSTMSRATRRIVVAHLMRDGMTVPQIASELGVSRDTVRRDAESARQDVPQDAQDAQQVMRPDAAPVAPQVAQYERQTARVRALLAEGLSVERLDALEEQSEDAPGAAVAEQLAALADWQESLSRLADALGEEGAVRPYLEAQRDAYEDARAATNAAFVGWHFGGWARMPQDAEDARGVTRPVARPGASGLLLPRTARTARDLEVLCAVYRARPEDAARFAIHEAARRLSAWRAARAHGEGRRTA